jgi:hypothetical protein
MTLPPALSRFKCHAVPGDGSGARLVTILTNLAGRAIRFTLNETIDNIVSGGTLTMLNAIIDELGEIQKGVLGQAASEEDKAKWKTIYEGAPVEPNQYVYVKEIWGSFTVNEEGDIQLGEDSEMCTTYWRVVNFASYVDDNDIPFCDVTLESMSKMAIESTLKPVDFASTFTEAMLFRNEDYHESLKIHEEIWNNHQFYQPAGDAEEIFGTGLRLINDPNIWLELLIIQLAVDGFQYAEALPRVLERMPLEKVYKHGEETWQAIEELLSFNAKCMRFRRDKTVLIWDVGAVSIIPEIIELGELGNGLRLQYTKENVFSNAVVKGFLGVKDENDQWKPETILPYSVNVESAGAANILNGQKVEQIFEVPADYLLENEEFLYMYGMKELYKTVLSARGVSVNGGSIPLVTEVGMIATGDSEIGGTTEFLITTVSRTTDVESQTIETSLTGNALALSAFDTTDTWVEPYDELSMQAVRYSDVITDEVWNPTPPEA